MKYVIQDTSVPQNRPRPDRHIRHYIFDKNLITLTLCDAKQFKTYIGALKFVYSAKWCTRYKIVKVSEKELFKAKLADT